MLHTFQQRQHLAPFWHTVGIFLRGLRFYPQSSAHKEYLTSKQKAVSTIHTENY